jgi:hypothetical protein
MRREREKEELTSWRSSRTLQTYQVSGTATVERQKPKDVRAHPIRMDTISHNCAASIGDNDVSPQRTGITKSP